MLNYFKSKYEPEIAYSPNWYGTLDYAPRATVLLYNDKEGYCIGYMESELPVEIEPMSEADALKELAGAKDAEEVWFGNKLLHRWDSEAEVETVLPDEDEVALEEPPRTVEILLQWCPDCHKQVARILKKEDGTVAIIQGGKAIVAGLKVTSLNLTCPAGHNVKVVLIDG